MFLALLTTCLMAAGPGIPSVELDSNGAIGSVEWDGRELLATTTVDRKQLVVFARPVQVSGHRALFELYETGSHVEVLLEPVENGIDIDVEVVGRGHEDVHLYLGQYGFQGTIGGLLPQWCGYIRGISFPADEGQYYPYPGHQCFAPVIANWDSRYTIGYSVLANIGDQIGLQLREPKNSTPAAMLHVVLEGGCEDSVTKNYEIAIRFASGPKKWREVLRPYQQHQVVRDGPVQYERLGPVVFYNMRNSHDYDFEGDRDFDPGCNWENQLGINWDTWLQQRDAGELRLGCTGVWAQQEQLDTHLEFNPDVLDLEASLDGELVDLVQRVRSEYDDVRLLAMSRPLKYVLNDDIADRDLTLQSDWDAAMSQLTGLVDLGFDVTYADQLGVPRSWEVVDFVEASPIRVIAEWTWDRLMTRCSAVSIHRQFPSEQGALLIPYLTPGGEMYIRIFDTHETLFAEGAVTPWSQWVADHNRARFNRFSTYIAGSAQQSGANNEPDDNVRKLRFAFSNAGDANMGPIRIVAEGEEPDQPNDPGDIVTVLYGPADDDGGGGDTQMMGGGRVIRIIRGRSGMTSEEVELLKLQGTARIVVNRRASLSERVKKSRSSGGSDGDGGVN
jgi:hypothetical protein